MQPAHDITSFASIVGVTPELVQIQISTTEAYEKLGLKIEIGSYLKISDDNDATLIVIVQGYRIRDNIPASPEASQQFPVFIIDTQPVGRLVDGHFLRGGKQITIPPRRVEIASTDLLKTIYGGMDTGRFCFGSLAQDANVQVVMNGDKFFGKHIGVIGSTGSGKSCTVAKILQEAMKPSTDQVIAGALNNSHIVIFDLHGEYSSAFPHARIIGAQDLSLPYWLMNSEELEEMFIESREQNSHNQISQFRQAVVENKRRHAGGYNLSNDQVSYDAPVYFSLAEVLNYLTNLNKEIVGKQPGEGCPKLADGTLIQNRPDRYFDCELDFASSSTKATEKAGNGPFNGEFNRFLMRLQSRRNDKRLDFLLAPLKEDRSEYVTSDLVALIQQITGYGIPKANVTILDLSGVPFEVLSVVVSLVSRLIFTFCFHYRKGELGQKRDLPFLLVYEEAHNYIPQSEGAKYSSVKKAIERIAKEGRKYGIALMIVSQRPSEISETVFSQCNNFVAMRLTNPTDQRYVERLLPDNLRAVTDSLPSLAQQEAIIIGDSVIMPSLVRVDDIEYRPDSRDIHFHSEWQRDWLAIEMQKVVDYAIR